MLRFALLLALVPFAAAADVPPLRLLPPEPPPRVCIAEAKCPAPSAIPRCKEAVRPADVRAAPAKFLGQTVSILGSLEKYGPTPTCTKMACSAKLRCCNDCEAELVIGPSAFNSQDEISFRGDKRFLCSGDDTGVCCGLPLGKPIRFTGLVTKRDGRLHIASPTLCIPEEPPHDRCGSLRPRLCC